MNIKTSLSFLISSFCLGTWAADPVKNEWNDTQAMVKVMEWQEQHPIFALAPTDWTNGVYYKGVSHAYKTTQDERYLAALKTMGCKNEWKPMHRIHHADDVSISYSYLFVSTTRRNLVDMEPTKDWLDKHLLQSNEWNGINGESKKPTLWWWCDALFMAPPVIAYYTALTGEEEYLEAMNKYYKETYDLPFDQEEKMFARDLRYVWIAIHASGEFDSFRVWRKSHVNRYLSINFLSRLFHNEVNCQSHLFSILRLKKKLVSIVA